jgi:uncharacterized protein (DUF488 family)
MTTIGTLYTIGYAHPDAAIQVGQLMNQEHMLLVDIRYSPYSRWRPAWGHEALEATFGECYLWKQRLGNVNYQHPELGIKLAEGHEDAAREVAKLLARGISVILLCTCKNARTCHRSLVAKLVQDEVQKLQEVAQA